ncbi:MAG: hypothetical protein JWQ84_555 [Mucilaginibacter sp.]|nr:hypothetical protein [Mucilaginibacter sp.]MDB5015723.1 hypothetical protein [Mucilaginibacter sp.]MDB5139605.1 hypothetical protein [Mucilaginibacter sp.]
MKKNKEESPVKASRKKAAKSIQLRISKLLETITNELGQDEQKAVINIEKEAKKLAKKIAKHLIVKKETVKEKPATVTAEKPVKQQTPKEAIVPKPPVAKAEKPVIEATKLKAVKTTAQKQDNK